MITLFLILFLIALFILGFFAMDRLARFADKNSEKRKKEVDPKDGFKWGSIFRPRPRAMPEAEAEPRVEQVEQMEQADPESS